MQNPTLPNISHISERILALIAEGASTFKEHKDITNCQKCALSATRKKVLVSSQMSQKDFFIISEYADEEDENTVDENLIYHSNSSSSIIVNLLTKLGIQNECHYAFALKCVPYKHIPQVGLSTCITQNLLKEIELISPKTIFCFGSRVFYNLAVCDLGLYHQAHLPQNSALPQQTGAFILTLGSQKMELYLLPTAQELKQFPKWRAPVWSQLAHFKKNIDS